VSFDAVSIKFEKSMTPDKFPGKKHDPGNVMTPEKSPERFNDPG
jgi:hypothetical protein